MLLLAMTLTMGTGVSDESSTPSQTPTAFVRKHWTEPEIAVSWR